MDTPSPVVPITPVESADVMQGNVLITFANGQCAIYSAKLLHDVFDHAEEVLLSLEEGGSNATRIGAR